MIEFEVVIKCGDVFINGEFVSQLCWSEDSVGMTIAGWLSQKNRKP